MSEGSDAERPHEASPRKAEEALKRGETPSARELGVAGAVAGIALAASGPGARGAAALAEGLAELWRAAGDPAALAGGAAVVERAGVLALGATAPITLAVAGGGLLAAALGRPRAAPRRLRPDPKRLSPAAGLKRILGPAGLFEFAKAVGKIAAVGGLAAAATWASLPGLVPLVRAPADVLVAALGERQRGAALLVLGPALAIAAADWFWGRAQWRRRQRMSDEEMRRETKQSDGDPRIKGRRRAVARERARRSLARDVREASFVVANPTHVAVALRYRRGIDPAPVVVAKGRDRVALRIRALAEEGGVPVREDRPLARALHGRLAVGQTIPEEFFEAVAVIVRGLDRAGGAA